MGVGGRDGEPAGGDVGAVEVRRRWRDARVRIRRVAPAGSDRPRADTARSRVIDRARAPKPPTRLARIALQRDELVGVRDVRRVRVRIRVPASHQLGVHEQAVAHPVHVRERAVVAIGPLDVVAEAHAGTRRQQIPRTPGSLPSEATHGLTRVLRLRSVDPDEPYALATIDHDRVTVDDVVDGRVVAGKRAIDGG